MTLIIQTSGVNTEPSATAAHPERNTFCETSLATVGFAKIYSRLQLKLSNSKQIYAQIKAYSWWGESVPWGGFWAGESTRGCLRPLFHNSEWSCEVFTATTATLAWQKVETLELDSDAAASGAGEHRLGVPVQPSSRMETIKPNTSS